MASFGVEIYPTADASAVLEDVEAVERLGYDDVWLGDSQLIWRELYVLLGAAAVRTSRVGLGTGVTNPLTRHASVTASAAMTLQELSGGRAVLGVGAGDSSLRTMGLTPAGPSEVGRFVEAVRGLCRGEALEAAGDGGREVRLVFGKPEKAPPLMVAASGPKMLGVAGRHGDGVILAGNILNAAVLDEMLRRVREGRKEAGGARGFKVFAAVPACVHDDREKAIEAVRAHVASSLLLRLRWGASEAALDTREQLRREYDYYEHMKPSAQHAAIIPHEVVSEFALTGTADDCIQQATVLFDAGVDQITIRPYGIDGQPPRATIDAFAREVLARMD